jgi:hypothetical protein
MKRSVDTLERTDAATTNDYRAGHKMWRQWDDRSPIDVTVQEIIADAEARLRGGRQ